MNRLLTWLVIIFIVIFVIPVAFARKPKLTVQLYGESFSTPTSGMSWYVAFLILPDGSHATAHCGNGPGTAPCEIEPFAAEKRVKVPCDLLKGDGKGFTCYQSESYEAERKNNDITLRTGNGKVTYHIDGAW